MVYKSTQEIQERRDKLKSLLRDIFQIDASSDLDFGIYRIMNHKKKDIEVFIEKELMEEIEMQFKQFEICNGEKKLTNNTKGR